MTLPTEAYTAIEESSLSDEDKQKLNREIQTGKIEPEDAIKLCKGGGSKKKASSAPKTQNKKMGVFSKKASESEEEDSSSDE